MSQRRERPRPAKLAWFDLLYDRSYDDQAMAISVLSLADGPNATAERLPEAFPLPEDFPPPVAMNRTTLRVVQLTDYAYAIPARQVQTELRLLPPHERGWQRRIRHDLKTAPLPHTTIQRSDPLGNDFWDVRHERVQAHLTFAAEIEVTTCCAYNEDGIALPIPIASRPGESPETYRQTTHRTLPGEEMKALVEAVCATFPDRRPSLRLFAALCQHVHKEMHFDSKATGIQTTAREAWQLRHGVCQDYTHITLALCRLLGIPARYASGFVPGEGVMHAWVEAMIPVRVQGRIQPFWFAYDPTYDKWVDDNYVTVAVGRDYADITPTSGTYFGGASTVKYRNKVTVLSKTIHLL